MHKLSGSVNINGSIMHVSQIWLQNASIKENILFGNTYSDIFYKKCIRSCGLINELNKLPNGDNTEIGKIVKF